MPTTPSSVSASFTSSSLNGLMMASIFFISDLLKDRDRKRRDVRADAFQVCQDIQVDLRRLDGLGEAGAQPSEVGLAQIPLAVPDHGALVEDFLRQAAVVGGEGGDGPLEVLSDQSVELLDLRPARVGEPPSLIELLPAELHQVLVDDVADVLEVADERNQRDLLAREVRAHRLAPEPGEEELDLPLEEVDLVVAPRDVLQELRVIAPEHDRHVAEHSLHHVGHSERLAGRLAERQGRLLERSLVEIAGAERAVALLSVRHERFDRPRRPRREGQERKADTATEERR